MLLPSRVSNVEISLSTLATALSSARRAAGEGEGVVRSSGRRLPCGLPAIIFQRFAISALFFRPSSRRVFAIPRTSPIVRFLHRFISIVSPYRGRIEFAINVGIYLSSLISSVQFSLLLLISSIDDFVDSKPPDFCRSQLRHKWLKVMRMTKTTLLK